MSQSKNLWQALESIPGSAAVEVEWKAHLKDEYTSARAFLRPNGNLASSYPCSVPNGCGCAHEVIIHAPEDIMAVCRCEQGCETFRLSRSDIVVYELDRSVLEAAIVAALGIFTEAESKTYLRGTTRIGAYSPYAGFRFPVYFTIQIEPDEFTDIVDGLLGRNEVPFILLAPTRELCTAAAEERLSRRKSVFLSLSDNLRTHGKRSFRLLRPLDDVLSQFRAAVLPAPKDEKAMSFSPTPPAEVEYQDVFSVIAFLKAQILWINFGNNKEFPPEDNVYRGLAQIRKENLLSDKLCDMIAEETKSRSKSIVSFSPFLSNKEKRKIEEDIDNRSDILKMAAVQLERAIDLAIEAKLVSAADKPTTSAALSADEEKARALAAQKKEPPKHYIAAYRLYIIGMTQAQIAMKIQKQFGKPFAQGQVSRAIKRVKRYVEAGNVLPELTHEKPKPANPVDPSRLDLGPRTDKRVNRRTPSD